MTRHQEAVGLEILVTGVKDGVEHGLVEERVAHPFTDNDVDLGDRELNLLNLASDQGDTVCEAIDSYIDARFVDNVGVVYSDDTGCARLRAEHGQDTCPAANI